MRLCDGLLCDEAANIWFRGAWCGKCALKRFGKRDVVLAARFSELHRSLEASRSLDPSPPLDDRGEGSGWRPNPSPVSRPQGRTAVMGQGFAPDLAGEPSAPLTEAELLDVLERENWGSEWQGW